MRIQITRSALAVAIALLAASSCNRNTPAPLPASLPPTGDTGSTIPIVLPSVAVEVAADSDSNPDAKNAVKGACDGALDAISSCALATTCDEDIALYLPAASRDALLSLEASPHFSFAAFDRYCLSACKERSGALDVAEFSKEVCNARPDDPAAAATAGTTASSFYLHSKLEVGNEGVSLAEFKAAFGEPATQRDSRYDCGSVFEEGSIKEYLYPDFVIETDGKKAIVRSMQLSGRNQLKLSDGKLLGALDEAQFKKRFGDNVPRYGKAYRLSDTDDGSLESGYDFQFNSVGRLERVDYFIAC